MQWIRQFSTKRTIPYITKGNWKLPLLTSNHNEPGRPRLNQSADRTKLPNDLKTNELQTQSHSEEPDRNSDPKEITNVPAGWRQMKHLSQWKRQKFALREKFPDGWKPLKKLDRGQMERMREVKVNNPSMKAHHLGEMFKVSPETVRRILKSKWRPNAEESERIEQRWVNRGRRLEALKVVPRKKPGRLYDYGQNIF